MRAMRRSVVAVLVAGAVVWSHAPALAQEDPETLIKQGLDLRRRGDPERAYGYFKRAYDLGNTPRAAAQLGLVECSLRNFVDSEHHLSEALAAKDPWVEKYRALLEDTRKKARAQLARVEIRGVPAGGTVAAGQDVPRPLPSDGIVYLLPGRIALTVAAAGQRVEKTISAQPGETIAVDAELTRPTTPPPATALAHAAPTLATAPPPQPAMPGPVFSAKPGHVDERVTEPRRPPPNWWGTRLPERRAGLSAPRRLPALRPLSPGSDWARPVTSCTETALTS
jgi:hypothetical protein